MKILNSLFTIIDLTLYTILIIPVTIFIFCSYAIMFVSLIIMSVLEFLFGSVFKTLKRD